MLASAVAVLGLLLIVVALVRQVPAPEAARSLGRIDPPAATASLDRAAEQSGRDSGSGAASTRAADVPLPASRPVSVSIPAIDVRSSMISLGVAADGTLQVPQPGPDLNKVAWFDRSPTPGQPGPSVIEGHVDTEEGPSVFYRLNEMRPGQRIEVTRADGIRAIFTVDAVRNYDKAEFPTRVVYGSKDLSRPQLRVITCANFDPSRKTYTGNAVVFASLTAVKRDTKGTS